MRRAVCVLLILTAAATYPEIVVGQDKAEITAILKERLAVSDAKTVSVRQYDVPPGWATPVHEHTGHMFLYVVEGSGAMETEGHDPPIRPERDS